MLTDYSVVGPAGLETCNQTVMSGGKPRGLGRKPLLSMISERCRNCS